MEIKTACVMEKIIRFVCLDGRDKRMCDFYSVSPILREICRFRNTISGECDNQKVLEIVMKEASNVN